MLLFSKIFHRAYRWYSNVLKQCYKPFSIKFTQWSKIIYENKLTEAGFSDVGWDHFSLSDEGIA